MQQVYYFLENKLTWSSIALLRHKMLIVNIVIRNHKNEIAER